MSTNNLHVGATSSLWNTDGRDRGKKFTTSLDLFVKFYFSCHRVVENFIFIFSLRRDTTIQIQSQSKNYCHVT